MSSPPNPCKNGKFYNNVTKRCLKSCKPNQTRNSKLRCVNKPKQRKINISQSGLNNKSATGLNNVLDSSTNNKCKDDKFYNHKTKKCLKACKPNQMRNLHTLRCVTSTKPMPTESTCNALNKDLDTSFRCIPKCKPGKFRNSNGKCV